MKKEKTQREKLEEALSAIKDEVTALDKVAYQDKTETSKSTVSNYFNGKISDYDKAVDMLNFFRKRIADRDRKIALPI